jgi:ectoine hydroxylase-related dioxygenase (phytanoyl-CoA dioxygenase family)
VTLEASAEIPRFDPYSAPEAIADAIASAGVSIVHRLAVDTVVNGLERELDPYLESVPFSDGYFMGRRTKRTSRLIVKSPTSRTLVVHPLVMEVVGRVLREHCYSDQLHSTMAIRIHPGETAQTLHRDDNVFPFRHPGPPSAINVIWALEDFTSENGGTRVVPRSHLWDDERKPSEHEAITAVMPRGSVLMFDTAVYHGGGANRSHGTRASALFAYSLGWLRQLENQFLAVPRNTAKTLPAELLELLGYRAHGFLGSFECQSPLVALADEVPDVLPPEDLYTNELQRRALVRR